VERRGARVETSLGPEKAIAVFVITLWENDNLFAIIFDPRGVPQQGALGNRETREKETKGERDRGGERQIE
jgi:hypothetical protein